MALILVWDHIVWTYCPLHYFEFDMVGERLSSQLEHWIVYFMNGISLNFSTYSIQFYVRQHSG